MSENKNHIIFDLSKLIFIEMQYEMYNNNIFVYFEYHKNNELFLYQIKLSYLYEFNKKYFISDLKIWGETKKYFPKPQTLVFYFSEAYTVGKGNFIPYIGTEEDEKKFIKFEKKLINRYIKSLRNPNFPFLDIDEVKEGFVDTYFITRRKRIIKKLLDNE